MTFERMVTDSAALFSCMELYSHLRLTVCLLSWRGFCPQKATVSSKKAPTSHRTRLGLQQNRQRDELDEPDVFLSRETRARPNQS